MKLLVTGASGYIGARFMRLAHAHGHVVVAATRRPLAGAAEWVPYELSAMGEERWPMDIAAVVHVAADTSRGGAGVDELAAAQRLLAFARRAGAHVVFVSSQTARANAPTDYGRVKWQIEQLVAAEAGTSVRPGMVYGGPERGLFGTLVQLVRSMPVLPAFLPAPLVQPVHVDDLATFLLRCVERPDLRGCVHEVGGTHPVAFTTFLRAIARYRTRRVRLFVPVPVFAVRAAVWMLGPLSTRLGLQRLLSLFDLPPLRPEQSLQRCGMQLRPLCDGMSRNGDGRRRRLLAEGKALLTYVLRTSPSVGLLARYARCIEALNNGAALPLPTWTLRSPAALRLLEGAGGPASERPALGRRLDIAVALAEASIQGAQRFLALGARRGMLGMLLRVARALASEACWRIAQAIAWSFRRHWRAEGRHGL